MGASTSDLRACGCFGRRDADECSSVDAAAVAVRLASAPLGKAKLDGDESSGSTGTPSRPPSPTSASGQLTNGELWSEEHLSLIDLRSALQDVLAFLLSDKELGRLSMCERALRAEVTVENHSPTGPLRRLIVPVVELQLTTAEDELARVSLPHIRTLRISNRLSLNAVVAAGKKAPLRSLERFICKMCPLQPADVREVLEPLLRATRTLKLLNLEKSRLTCEFLKALSKSEVLARVETLNLRNNNIGNAGAQAFASSRYLQTVSVLNLKQNNIGDKGVGFMAAMLAKNSSIRLLNLRRQTPALTDASAEALATALRTNGGLTSLRLRRNRIGDAGASALALAAEERLIAQCKEVPPGEEVALELDLEENQISAEGTADLLHMANAVPARAEVSVLLFDNPVTKEEALPDQGPLTAQTMLFLRSARLRFDNVPELY
eukprot:TRINITY_DN5164_c0_g1_i2.p1 TRINITY_DN5164_c0_g1~~TRINITY_DN5164_c0_g1_i2.p1  ORF type:complete len:436 (+),score=110.35 TRINITY_DN5164_c0_g1_i2:116-1423(+)